MMKGVKSGHYLLECSSDTADRSWRTSPGVRALLASYTMVEDPPNSRGICHGLALLRLNWKYLEAGCLR